MSLKPFAQTLVLLGFGAICAQLETAATVHAKPPVETAPAREHRGDSTAGAEEADDALMNEILGVSEQTATKPPASANLESWLSDRRLFGGAGVSLVSEKAGGTPRPRGKAGSEAVFKCIAVQPETSASPPATKAQRQSGSGSMFGRIIGVDLDTNTVDIQFEGQRQTTVGSKFSVHHDYAFSTEYLGQLEIVYLAGGNRAIAKPGQRTDVTKMGKGDRVGGRIVPGKNGAANGAQSGTGASSGQNGAAGAAGCSPSGSSSGGPSCNRRPTDEMPVPPPDPVIPYVPDDMSLPDDPGPAPEITQAARKPGSFSPYHSALQRRQADAPRKSSPGKSSARPLGPTRSAQPAKAIKHPPRQPAHVPLGIPTKSGYPTAMAPQGKWSAITARSWGALTKPNRNSPATVALERQSSRTASSASSSVKPLWCSIKPKPVKEDKSARTASLSGTRQPPTILLFDSE